LVRFEQTHVLPKRFARVEECGRKKIGVEDDRAEPQPVREF